MNYRKAISNRLNLPKHTSAATVALALAGGVLLGAVVSLLFAPQSGEETRGMLADKTRDLTDSVKDKFKTMKGRLRAEAEEHVERVQNGVHNA